MCNLLGGVGCSSGDSLSKFLRLEKVDIRYVEMPKELLDMWKSQRLFWGDSPWNFWHINCSICGDAKFKGRSSSHIPPGVSHVWMVWVFLGDPKISSSRLMFGSLGDLTWFLYVWRCTAPVERFFPLIWMAITYEAFKGKVGWLWNINNFMVDLFRPVSLGGADMHMFFPDLFEGCIGVFLAIFHSMVFWVYEWQMPQSILPQVFAVATQLTWNPQTCGMGFKVSKRNIRFPNRGVRMFRISAVVYLWYSLQGRWSQSSSTW